MKGAKAFVCLLLGAALGLSALLGALSAAALSPSRFAEEIARRVPLEAYQIPAEDGERFAAQTIAYLRGELPRWEPTVSLNGAPLPIPQAFTVHMAEVRGIVQTGTAALWALLCLSALLLLPALRGFSGGAYYAGLALPFVPVAVLALWAAVGFDSLWQWLHQTFLPGGIFSASEPIMLLFPPELFADYLPPVALWLGAFLAAALLWPLVFRKAGKA